MTLSNLAVFAQEEPTGGVRAKKEAKEQETGRLCVPYSEDDSAHRYSLPLDGEAKRATMTVAPPSICSYSERQKPAKFKGVNPMNKC